MEGVYVIIKVQILINITYGSEKSGKFHKDYLQNIIK